MEVDWVSGACMVIRRKAIDAVGCFDERFFMYWEDADWCKRMWDGGWKVVYYPLASIVHHVGVSSSQLLLKSRFEFHKSVYLLFEKYSPTTPWLIKIMVMASLFARFGLLVAHNGITRCAGTQGACRCITSQAMPGLKKIKILRLIARLNVGGPTIHVHLLTTGLNPERFESFLVTGMISDKEGDMSYLFQDSTHKPYQVSEMQRDIRIPMDIRVMYRIFKLICQFQPDIVHTHTAKAGFTARITVFLYNLIFRKNVKIVHTFHGHVFDGYFSRAKSWAFVQIERLLARMTDVIIAISETQRNDLAIKYHIAPLEKIRIIELGFDLKPFLSCAALKGRFREKLGVGDETILVGIIGRLVPIKNHEMFFKAVRLFLKANPEIDIKFVVVGDGECRQQLEAYCREQNLTRHVVFWGWIQNVSLVYADLNILALTSLNEGTPVSIIEAMASSVSVIATQVGGIQDLIGKPVDSTVEKWGFTVYERGILSHCNDPAGFSKGLSYLAREDLTAKLSRIQRARTYVVNRFAKERLLKDVELLYSQLMIKEMK
jgi:glycosyltransferase involved in cell wall biosynthesis